MFRKLIVGASVAALTAGGLAAVAVGQAGAAKPVITQVTGGSVNCSMEAKAKIKPKLKNNWVQAAHAGDIPAVAALPNTTFADQAPVNVSANAKTIACTGSVTNGVASAAVTGMKIKLTQISNAIDNPPLSPGATCVNLLSGTNPEDVAATYQMHIKFKTVGAKLADTTITGSQITPGGGLGFIIDGGTIGGSFAGGSSSSQAYIDPATLAAVTAAPATSSQPVPSSVLCEASLKIKDKTKKGVVTTTAKFKKPKGLGKIVVGNNLLPPGDPSTITMSVP